MITINYYISEMFTFSYDIPIFLQKSLPEGLYEWQILV